MYARCIRCFALLKRLEFATLSLNMFLMARFSWKIRCCPNRCPGLHWCARGIGCPDTNS